MDSVERMTRALQVAAEAMRDAREKNPPAELLALLDDARVRILKVAKHEAGAGVDSRGVQALSLVVQRRYPEALELLADSRAEWQQRGMTAQRALDALTSSRDEVLSGEQVRPDTAAATFDLLVESLQEQVTTAGEIVDEYAQLAEDTKHGAAALGLTA